MKDSDWLIQVRRILHHNVPRFIQHISDRGGVSEEEFRWLQSENDGYPMDIIMRADEYLLYPKNMQVFEQGIFTLVLTLAIMAFIPGGVRFCELHFSSEINGFVIDESMVDGDDKA